MAQPGHDRHRAVYIAPWRIDVTTRAGVPSPLRIAAIARAVAAALETADAPAPGSVTVVLTDDEEMAELNATHLGHEGPTDVLSFPMLESDAFDRDSRTLPPPRQRAPRANRQNRSHIGDIAISVQRVADQAEQGRGGQTGDVKWSAADEMRLLVTHGTLHLCGWDHAEPSEESKMRALERRLAGSQNA
jgi:probable rRNA maturation factor